MNKPFAAVSLAFCLSAGGIPGALAQADKSPAESGSGNHAGAASGQKEARNAADLDLEELANTDIQVTSASKKREDLLEAPAAIAVLTGEDLERSGFTTLPEALRMVPGLYVGQTNAHIWQISTRGFSDLNNNKMLVLVDGRSAYTPQLGSVFWDVLDIPLENIDRVEVIRGPGGTLWGANAVNGVINIVTRKAVDAQGALVSTAVDPEEGYTATLRYGGQIGSKVGYYVFGRGAYWQPLGRAVEGGIQDEIALPQAGARVDWAATPKDRVTLETGSYDGRFRSAGLGGFSEATNLLKGNHVGLDWTHALSGSSAIETLAYCDWNARYGVPGELRNSCDLEFQHSLDFDPRHSLIWGGSFFTTGDDLSPDSAPYTRERRRESVVSGFAQYQVEIVPGRFRILAGSKLEHNGYTGFEYQPQVRAVWTPRPRHSLWASMSRAVRIPSRNNSDLNLLRLIGQSNGIPLFVDVHGNPHLDSEKIKAYEIGYRYQPRPVLLIDLALYYNDYSGLIRPADPVPEVQPTRIILHEPFINGPGAETHGGELTVTWDPVSHWRIKASATELHGSPVAVDDSSQHIFNLQSQWILPRKTEFTLAMYHNSSVPAVSSPFQPLEEVPAFTRMDAGLAWHPLPEWTLAVWGRNLQSPQHQETRDTIFGNQEGQVPRAVVFQLIWRSKGENTGPRP